MYGGTNNVKAHGKVSDVTSGKEEIINPVIQVLLPALQQNVL